MGKDLSEAQMAASYKFLSEASVPKTNKDHIDQSTHGADVPEGTLFRLNNNPMKKKEPLFSSEGEYARQLSRTTAYSLDNFRPGHLRSAYKGMLTWKDKLFGEPIAT